MDMRGINWQRLGAPQDHAVVSGMQCPPGAQPGGNVNGYALLSSHAVLSLRASCATLKPHVSKQSMLDKMMPVVRLIIPCICPYLNKVVTSNLHGWRERWESSFILQYFPLFKFGCVSGVLRNLRVQTDVVRECGASAYAPVNI
jgi:hypothetical protein